MRPRNNGEVMKIELEPTSQIVSVSPGVRARVWRGTTDRGVEIQALLVRVACAHEHEEECERLASELEECAPPPPEPRAFGTEFLL